jgi:hypothetical protein
MSVQTSYATAPAAAFAGMLAGQGPHDIITMENADTASMPFGIVVAYDTSSPTSDKQALLPASGGAKLAGIVCHSHDNARQFSTSDANGNTVTVGDLDGTGLVPGAELAVLQVGVIWVKVQQAVVPGDRMFVCITANVVYTAIGQIGNADESSNTIDATKVGVFISSAAAGGFAKLRVDFTNHV